jgi:exosortase
VTSSARPGFARLGFAGLSSPILGGGRLPLRAVALVACVLVAYNYSLQTLVRGITLQTPLAYLAFVPVIALILAWVSLTKARSPRPIHDRQIDYIIGLSLIATAAAIALLAPGEMTFWLDRLDLLGLPFFVAGLVALLYGVRRLWTLKVPIFFLLLAWPAPYAPLVGDGMQRFADLTASAVTALSHWIQVAQPAPGDDAVFYVGTGLQSFAVSIGSACAGVNSLVGFVIIGAALAYAVRGSAVRRLLWLGGGLTIIWLLNIVRIEAIFLVGAAFGQSAALDVLHPVAGLLVFNIGVVGMLVATGPMGLRFVEVAPSVGSALRAPRAVSRVRRPLVAVAGLAVALGVVNAGYARYEAMANDFGTATLKPFDIRQAAVSGWSSAYVAEFDQVRQYFGQSATWDRFLYSSTSSASVASSRPVYIDVINTDDAGSLAAYGLQACYQFHGFVIEATSAVDLGNGLTAQIIDYHNPKIGNDWSAIWWEWPYLQGSRTSYQRLVVFLAGGPSATYSGADNSLPIASSGRFAGTDQFLATLARMIVRTHVTQTAGA